jgi:hypothetical protein
VAFKNRKITKENFMKFKMLIIVIISLALNAKADVITRFQVDIILEMNLVRSNPGLYAERYLVPLLEKFHGDTFTYGGGINVITEEGVEVVKECIRQLKRSSSAPELILSRGMSRGANDHVKDQSSSGEEGHRGSDNSKVVDRIDRYGKWGSAAGENISYGLRTPRDIIISLLIDDGVYSRGHRKTILAQRYLIAGVAFGSHPEYKTMCVLTYAKEYRDH